MIEDVLHNVVDHARRERRAEGWDGFRLWMYAPMPGDIRRARHLDGRGPDPKYDMVYAYGGELLEGALRATCERTD